MKIVNFYSESVFSDEEYERLLALGEVVDVPRGTLTDEQAKAFLEDAEYAIMAPSATPHISRAILQSAKKLKGIVINTTNTGWVDREAAKEAGISIKNIPGYSTEAVAELATGLMFGVARHIPKAVTDVKEKGTLSFEGYEGIELSGKTLGIIGFGDIGRRVAELASGLGMDILAWNRTEKTVPGIAFVSLPELLGKSDVVSIHLAADLELTHFMNKEKISQLKPGAILINVSREELIETPPLMQALGNGGVSGFAFELNEEPWTEERKKLVALPNVIATPHIGWFTPEAQARSQKLMVEALEELIKDAPDAEEEEELL